MAKEIIVTVGKDGEVDLEASGFKGGTCEKALEPIIQAVGQAVSVKKKPEFYQRETEQTKCKS